MRKRTPCPKCCPDKPVPFDSDFNLKGETVWACENCGHELPRKLRSQKAPAEDSPLTSSQIQAITTIQQYKLKGFGVGSISEPEIKRFQVRNMGRFVSVVVEVGRKGDEGTLGAILGRERGQFFVGRNGGITAVESSKGTAKGKLKKYPLIYGWRG